MMIRCARSVGGPPRLRRALGTDAARWRAAWAGRNPTLGDFVVRRTLNGLAALALIGTVGATAAQAQEAAPAAQAPAAQPAPADQGGIEEIIVISRMREESIQDVPLAVSAFGQEAIEALSPSTLQDFDGLTPNVFIGMNATGPGASAIYIRGIGYADIEKTQTPNVGVVIDGVFVPSSTGQLIDTFDIQSLEVNRGPQAILWGRNTSGGTIVVRRGQPVLGEWDAKLLTSYGDYTGGEGDGGAFKVQAVANIPLNEDTLALRLGYTNKQEQGYWINTADGKNRGGVDYNAINAKLLWQPTEALSVLFNWDWIEDRSDILPQDARWDGNDPWVNKSDRIPRELAPYNVSVTSMEVNYELPFNAKFTSISAYWDSHDLVYQDFDAGVSFSRTSQPVFCASAAACAFANPAQEQALFPAHFNDPQAVLTRLHTRREQEYDVFSQEFRLQGTLLDESLTYITGFYYARDDHDHGQRTEQQLQLPVGALGGSATPPPGGFNLQCQVDLGGGSYLDFSGPVSPVLGQLCTLPTSYSSQTTFLTNKSWALFGSLEYELPWIEGLRINGGVRYIKENKEFDTSFDNIANNTIVGSVIGTNILSLSGQKGEWDDVVGEAGVNYQVMDNLMVYYRFAQGFRSGGFSLRGSGPVPSASEPRAWPITFNPETTNSHEAGVKSSWWDSRLVTNFAAFYNKVEGGQGSSIISGITPVGTNTLILNGGYFKVYGVELQSSLEVIENLNVDFTLGWQKAGDNRSTQNSHNLPFSGGDTLCNSLDTDAITPGVQPIPVASQSEATCPSFTFRNTDLGRVPELTWSIGGLYRLPVGPGEFLIGSRVRHNDFFWILPPAVDPLTGASSGTPVPQSGYTLVDANLSYEFDYNEHKIRAGIVGRNLGNKKYKDQELPLGPGGFRGWGPPRYIGGELQLEL
jgi:iron complex outermembrane receptor protein